MQPRNLSFPTKKYTKNDKNKKQQQFKMAAEPCKFTTFKIDFNNLTAHFIKSAQ